VRAPFTFSGPCGIVDKRGVSAMATIVLELPDILVDKAKEEGLLSSAGFEEYIRKSLARENDDLAYPPGFPSWLKGAVSPDLYKKGKINGDIIGPFDEEWGKGY
jgi:hypothetical protein